MRLLSEIFLTNATGESISLTSHFIKTFPYDLHDPLINSYHAVALKLATKEEIEQIKAMAFKVNAVLKDYFLGLGVKLVDFKLEFGRTADGEIVLADEISPDTCRFWDKDTNEKLDKDRFRRDMGGVEDAYKEMMKRVFGE